MSEQRFDVVGLGNAIVDVLTDVEDAFLSDRGLVKGSMGLVDEDAAHDLYGRIRPRLQCSGGSAANTMVGIASLGGRAAFVGRVHADEVGDLFARDIREAGVAFDTPPATEPPATGRCLVLVSDDAERTMQTFLGAAAQLSIEDVHAAREWIRGARVTYLEGYLFDPPPAQAAFRAAAALAHDAGGQVALSLSDAFCVDRHRGAFRELVRDHVDVLFANEVEIRSLYETDTFDDAVREVGAECDIAVLTRGAQGATVVTRQGRFDVPAEKVERVVDTTGAGDLFAAGYLYGHTRDLGPARSARIGAIAAAEIVSHYGARPEARLADRLVDL